MLRQFSLPPMAVCIRNARACRLSAVKQTWRKRPYVSF